MRFRTTLLQTGRTAAGVVVPEEVLTALAAGRRPKVTVTINGHRYRTSVGTIEGRPMIGVSADVRATSGAVPGTEIEMDVELDTAPREVEVPADLASALDADPAARATFNRLSYSNRRFWIDPLVAAKTDETRRRRIDKAIATLREGRSR